MDSGIVELAKMFKCRENKTIDRWIIGTITSISPLKIKVSNFEFDENNGELIKLSDTYTLNNRVVLIPSTDQQQYLVVGEVK